MKYLNTTYRIIFGALAFLGGVSAAKGDFLREGRDAFLNYDFELASEYYEKYAKALKKSPNAHGEELLETYIRQLETAENALENVQKIEVIGRMDVPVSEFLSRIKLPASAGLLLSKNASELKNRRNLSDFIYYTESGDLMMWSENDDDHREVLMQSERLMDGSWEQPVKAGEILNGGGNARNPFLLSDGLTLYYSSDGEDSMGGFDLFVATKDPVSGEFRQPIGLGYPFNSPFNEYMMAIDEDNGIGWWVTDRNQLDGLLSVYVFKTNDIRKNYVMDEEEDIVGLAKLADITLTQNPQTDYASIMKEIDQRYRSSDKSSGTDFIFPMPGGKVATKLSDFNSGAAKRSMQQYLEAMKEHEALEKNLGDLRRKFHESDKKKGSATALRNQILDLEKQRDWQLERLKKMRNGIISSETKQ